LPNQPTAKLTTFIAKKGCLAKTFGLDKKGKLIKKQPGKIIEGRYETYEVTLKKLQAGLAKLSRKKCICLGTAKRKKGGITWKDRHAELGFPDDPIPRTTEYFGFHAEPTLCLLDVDGVDLPRGEVLAILDDTVPGFKEAGKLIVPSSSAGLTGPDGALLKDSTSMHIYFIVYRGDDIGRYMEVLFDRLWLAGHGRIQVSKSGALLLRGLIDVAVGMPERLIYEAAPVLKDGVTQEMGEFKLIEGGMLDTSLLKDLTPQEYTDLKALIATAKEAIAPRRKKIIAAYEKTEVAKLVKARDILPERAKKVVAGRRKHILDDEDILYFDGAEPILCKEVLENQQKWHGKALADPLEPDYDGGSTTKACFYSNEGRPVISSFAHGQQTYHFAVTPDVKEIKEGADDDPEHRDFFPVATMRDLRRLNKRHAAVLMGSKFRVIREDWDEDNRKHLVSFLEVGAFHNFYGNKKVKVPHGDDYKCKPVGQVWMEWGERRSYDNVVFAPSGCSPHAYNLFRGFAYAPKKGDWSLMKKHTWEVICRKKQHIYDFLMTWMARVVQDPGGKRPGVAVALLGGKGIGKGQWVDYFGAIFGEAFTCVSSQKGFTGSFNMHLSKSLLVFLDEAVWGGSKADEGTLKAHITEDSILFEPKGVDAMNMRNHMNVILASNESWAIPAGIGERRFLVLNISEKYKKDFDYFQALRDERDNGGVAAMMYDLMNWDMSKVNLFDAPNTQALVEQVQATFDPTLLFWESVLERGFMLSELDGSPRKSRVEGELDDWPKRVYKEEVYTEFVDIFCRRGVQHIPAKNLFWRITRKFWKRLGDALKREGQRGIGEARLVYIEVPELYELRRMFTDALGVTFDDMEDDEGEGDVPFDDKF